MKKLKSEKQTEMISYHGSSQLRTNCQQSRYENNFQARVLLFKISVFGLITEVKFFLPIRKFAI